MKYQYNAIVKKVYDGDTVTVDIDLGMDVWIKNQVIRLWGIDAPEIRGPEREVGLKARDYLRILMPVGKPVLLHTIKDSKGKYGRYLGVFYIIHGDGTIGNSISEHMVNEGHAVWVEKWLK